MLCEMSLFESVCVRAPRCMAAFKLVINFIRVLFPHKINKDIKTLYLEFIFMVFTFTMGILLPFDLREWRTLFCVLKLAQRYYDNAKWLDLDFIWGMFISMIFILYIFFCKMLIALRIINVFIYYINGILFHKYNKMNN